VREDVEITAARERDRLRAEVARGETLQGFGDIDQRLNRLLRDEPADEVRHQPDGDCAQQHRCDDDERDVLEERGIGTERNEAIEERLRRGTRTPKSVAIA